MDSTADTPSRCRRYIRRGNRKVIRFFLIFLHIKHFLIEILSLLTTAILRLPLQRITQAAVRRVTKLSVIVKIISDTAISVEDTAMSTLHWLAMNPPFNARRSLNRPPHLIDAKDLDEVTFSSFLTLFYI